jgi:hypothetical protein
MPPPCRWALPTRYIHILERQHQRLSASPSHIQKMGFGDSPTESRPTEPRMTETRVPDHLEQFTVSS